MTILDALADRAATSAVGDWRPTRYTKPLRPDFTSDGDKLIRFARNYWSVAELDELHLDDWQTWLIRAVLETYPPDWPVERLRGQLRYRQVVISMGRQNGKSLLGALFVIYFLALHVRGPLVKGLASIDAQAKIVYDRVKYGIDNSPALSRELRTTETRGIRRRDNTGEYITLPAKEDSAQGHPASGVLYDELHLGLAALWDAMILAMRARRNSLMVGLTTAGDDGSELLVRLYAEGDVAIEGGDERFGFFLWEAADDEMTEANVIAANPAIACGRIPLDDAMADARKMYADLQRGPDGLTGRQRAIRYTLNRFVKGAAAAWASVEAWDALPCIENLDTVEPVYTFARTPSWEAASVVCTELVDGRPHTELVASLTDASPAQLTAVAKALAERGACVFAGDAAELGGWLNALRVDGYEVWKLGQQEMAAAAQGAAGAIERGDVTHAHDELIRHQFTKGRRREQDTGWRLSTSLSTGEIDALKATVMGVYVAELRHQRAMQLG